MLYMTVPTQPRLIMDLIQVKYIVKLSHSKLNRHGENMRQRTLVNKTIDALCKDYPVKFLLSCYPLDQVPERLEHLIRKNICTREQVQHELRHLVPQTRIQN
eukprot:NODE_107_length_18988_cov_0.534491.p20 type:complete len:102 gc:universal NODE_107_length_18988_cov_0.534491:12351-12046(-)